MPDILVFYNSFTLAIELKTDTGKVSPMQADMHDLLRKAGVAVCIDRSVEDVEETLRTYGIPMRKMSYGPPRLPPSKGRRPQKPAQGAASAASQAEGA